MTELTVPFNDRLAGPYTATLGQTVFPYDFPVFADTDLLVVRRRAGVESVLVLTTDYTVTGAGQQAGGSVVLVAAAEAGDIISIYGARAVERTTDFQPPPNSPSAVDFNAELDRMQMQLQEARTLIVRAPRLRDTDDAQDLRLPIKFDRQASGAGSILGFDPLGLPKLYPSSLQGAQGPIGLTGPTGLQGIQGVPGDGLQPRAACVAATTANITLSGLQTIDGVVLTLGQRVLVKNQTAPAENGVYEAQSGAWTRTTDLDTWDELVRSVLAVTGGTVNADTVWVCVSQPGGTLGTTAVDWTEFPAIGADGPQGLTGAAGPVGPGLEPKASVNAATTANITLSGEQTIDGVAVVTNNRVLVKDQSAPAENGIYVAASGAWSRAADMDIWDEVPRALVPVLAGTANANTAWVCTSGAGGTLGTSPIAFSRLPVALPVIAPAAWAGPFSQKLIPNDQSAGTKTANTAAIQAVIDYAYANTLQVVNISAGIFWCDPGIYLDPPGNLRVNEATPTIFSFSMHLRGAGGLGNHENHGTQLKFTDNTTEALIVGTGQGMRVGDLSVLGPFGATSRAALPAGGIGIALAGGSGGLSRCLIDNVMVENFHRGVVTGYNSDSLCDSLTMFKCNVDGCFRGVNIFQTQNYINSLIECTFSNNTTHVYSPVGKAVNIIGGNYSGTQSNENAFSIGSTSALTSFSDLYFGNSFQNWSFTTTLAADDQPMIDGAYNAFVIKTANFGLVPLELTNYSSGTRVATFKLYRGWVTSHFWKAEPDLKANTDLEAELQAATLLHACEMTTVFRGPGINATGVHVENPGVATRLLDTTVAFNGDRVSRVDKAFFNYGINQDNFAGGTEAQKAIHYCQLAFPFVLAGHVGAVLSDCRLNASGGARGINIEVVSSTDKLIVRNCDFDNPNIIVSVASFGLDEARAAFTQTKGGGDWDNTPFFPPAETARYYAKDKILGVPYKGFSPAHWAVPRLRSEQLTAIEALGALGSYPSLHGQTIYSVLDETLGAPAAALLVRSAHQHFSYGQNLTVNWTYKGKTHVLALTDLSRMYAGLAITLDNGGGDQSYVVTGVYPTLGYVTIRGLTTNLLAGTQTTTYNGATVKQQAYSVSRSGTLPASKSVTNSGSGAQTAIVGDLTGAQFVNLLLTAVGAANFTTRTAAQMFADIPGCHVGFKYELTIRNTNAGTTTLVGGTGVTVTGTATIAQNVKRRFQVEFTSATACTITSLDAVTTV